MADPKTTGSAPHGTWAEPGPALLEVDAFERVRSERALLVAGHIGAHGFEHDRMSDQERRRLVVLDLLHALIELGALGLVRNHPRLFEQVVELRVAPLRMVLAGRFAARAAEKEEEVVGVAVVAGPAHLSCDVLAGVHALSIFAPLKCDELGVDADLGEIGLHHFAYALAVRVVRALHRLVPEIDVDRG